MVFFEKSSNIKFHENPPSGSRVFHADMRTDGRMDRQNEANSRFSQFCERALKKRLFPLTQTITMCYLSL